MTRRIAGCSGAARRGGATGPSMLQSGIVRTLETGRWALRGLKVAAQRRGRPYLAALCAAVLAFAGGAVGAQAAGDTGLQAPFLVDAVALSEAHDSGRCAADPLNLTLAAPAVNCCGAAGKCAFDASEWLPPNTRCWFVGRVAAVKLKYRLTVDRREAAALERVLSACAAADMVFTTGRPAAVLAQAKPPAASGATPDALRLYDDNRNGRITCSEARRHGIAPVPRDHPAYPFMRDGDGDGVVCE